MSHIEIEKKIFGDEKPTLLISEVGVNHNGSIERGYKLIEESVDSGADIVKFQTYKASQITTKNAKRYWDESLNDDDKGTQYDTFSKLDNMSMDGFKLLKKKCDELNTIFCSTPFNIPDVEMLEEIGVKVYKISSSDITYYDLMDKVASTNKPIILSTGCSSIREVEKAINIIHRNNNQNVLLQHCILQYPCEDKNANLAKMVKLKQVFNNIPVGYSDHTIGIEIPAMAVALGACSVEKHFTIDKKLPDSPDHKLSLDPKEFKSMHDLIRKFEEAKGVFVNGFYPAEEKAYLYARKSLVSKEYIKKGTIIKRNMLTAKRPGTGLYPESLSLILGMPIKKDIKPDTVLTKDMF